MCWETKRTPVACRVEKGKWSKLMKTINFSLELGIGKVNSQWKGIEEENLSINQKNYF
jgi:hypothetical protein